MSTLKKSEYNDNPEVGQILYNEYVNDQGEFAQGDLFFIDTPPEEGKRWLVTWIAQTADFGEGMEVYPRPAAGEMPQGCTRPATDDDIKGFVKTIQAEGGDPKQKLNEWINTLDTAEEFASCIKEDEKERLKNIISQSL